MNFSQIETRQKDLDRRFEELKRREPTVTKQTHDKFVADLRQLQDDYDTLDRDRKIAKIGGSAGSLRGYDGSVETKATHAPVSPLHIPTAEYKGLFEAVQRRLPSYRIDAKNFLGDAGTKAPFGEGSFTSGSLPPVLMPQLTQQLPYETDRLFEHFIQQKAPEASSVEWLQHTGNANPAAATAELAQKPDLGMELTTRTTSFTKIAALASFSTESLQDFSHFMSFVPAEMFRALIDAETDEVVNGSGSSPHMLGLLNQSGTLTRAIGSDTPVDCLRKAFNDLRVGSAFAHADLVAMHPTTWADIQLQKSSGGLCLLNPTDPNAIGDLTSIFGVKVMQNTWIPAGTALVFDTSKAILAWTRQAMTLEVNQYGTNEFGENYCTFRVECREAIGIQYPTAINIVSGLPSS